MALWVVVNGERVRVPPEVAADNNAVEEWLAALVDDEVEEEADDERE